MSNSKKAKWKIFQYIGLLSFVFMICLFTKNDVVHAATSTGKVTASSLNVRKSASTSAGIVGSLPKGTVVTVSGSTTKSGTKWYKVSAKVSGKSITGYASAQYISITSSASTKTGSSSSKGKVTATSLNVRKSASTSAGIVAGLTKGTEVTILDTTTNSGTKWYKVSAKVSGKTITGYVSAQYVSISATSSGTSNSTNTSSTFTKRYGYVKATSLNMRKSPSTTASIIAKLSKSQYVLICDKTTKSGTTWYYISTSVNGKTVRGYVSKAYIHVYTTKTGATEYNLATVKTNTLNVYVTANNYDTRRAVLKKAQNVIIRGSLKVRGINWSRIYAIVDGKGIVAYTKTAYLTKVTATMSNKESIKALTTKKTSAKKIAVTMAANVAVLEDNSVVTIRGSLTVLKKKWYKCTFKLSGKTHTGYILASAVHVTSDAEFLEELSDFPSSYHTKLKELHEEYPNWHFSAIHTGLDWDDVIENESKVGRNVIQSNVPKGGASGTYSAPFSYLSTDAGAYDWSKDAYKVYDGSNWYSANSKVVSHYMDPRNSLTENGIWQFESLAYDSRQKSEVVQSILSNTFMKGSYNIKDIHLNKTITGSYKDTFMEAGKENGASPYFLAIRSLQELGVNDSNSVSGTYSGYKGYYNYFNIGANDSSTGQAVANGLKYASSGTTFNRPWTNPRKAIIGGAEYIASSFIKKGQNTLYTQKFNVVASPLYGHQYMTNVQAPTSESKRTYSSYNNMKIADDSFVFYIPVYKDMPSSPCSLPASAGNPNSYLKSITVKHGSKSLALTPTFNYKTLTYTMVVDHSVSSVTVSASPISSHASVSGTGTFELTANKTKTVSIVCKAGNGTKTTYKVKISRKAS